MVMDESYVDGDCDGRLQQLMRQSVSNKSAIVKCRARTILGQLKCEPQPRQSNALSTKSEK